MAKKYKILFWAVPVFLIAVTGWWILQAPNNKTVASTTYTEIPITRGNISTTVSATGTLSPVNTVQVGSQVSGVISNLNADYNDHVKKGQVIAQIDSAVFRAKLAEADANLKSAQAAAEKARVTVRDAKRELDRQSNLFKKKLVAENVLDAARFAYDSANVEHDVQLAEVAQAEAAREREQVNLNYTSIYAPIDGTVISRDVDVGQTVAASLQAPTLFTIAQDLTQMQVEAEVDEAFIGTVKEGQSVYFSVFAYPGRKFEGRVSQVRLQPFIESGVVKYKSIIHVDNSDLALKPGMTATVAILVAEKKDVLQVPESALRFVPDWPEDELTALRDELTSEQRFVWTITDDELQPVKVTLGISGNRYVEISSDSLKEEMLVAIPEKRKIERKRRFGLSLF